MSRRDDQNPQMVERVECAVLDLRSTVPGTRLTVEGAMEVPPPEPSAPDQRFSELAVDCGRQLGPGLEQGTAGGGSDGNTASQSSGKLDCLGAVDYVAHAAHEFLDCRGLVERSALLALPVASPPLHRSDATLPKWVEKVLCADDPLLDFSE